jgi:hypothetical protein
MKTARFILSMFVLLSIAGLNEAFSQWDWTTAPPNMWNTNGGNVGIGNNAPAKLLYVAKNMAEPTITVRNLGGAGGATFQMMDNASGADWKFKSTNTGAFKVRDNVNGVDVLYFDPNSGNNSIYVRPAGVINFNNQSRVRAYQMDPTGMNLTQTIFPNLWTPINFTFDAPLPNAWDNRNEFIFAPAINIPAPPENSFFIAMYDGYYQVNARCEFNIDYWEGGPVQLGPNSYVSIAIYTGPLPGATAIFAEGNKLQVGYVNGPVTGILFNNNAPNVSDVVYLQAGQVISIWVYHTALSPMALVPGPTKVYVSIHKVS